MKFFIKHWKWIIGAVCVPLLVGLITVFGDDLIVWSKIKLQAEQWLAITYEPDEGNPINHKHYEYNYVIDFNAYEVNGRILDNEGKSAGLVVGYLRGGRVNLSYRSVNPASPGIGNIVLRYVQSKGAYEGYWTTVDCDLKKVLRCPMVLAKQHNKMQTLISAFPNRLTEPCVEVFSQLTQCK